MCARARKVDLTHLPLSLSAVGIWGSPKVQKVNSS